MVTDHGAAKAPPDPTTPCPVKPLRLVLTADVNTSILRVLDDVPACKHDAKF